MLLAIVLQQNLEALINAKGNKFNSIHLIIKNCDMALYKEKFATLTSVNVSQFVAVRAKNTTLDEEKD
jgi:hypothetical protein